MVQCLRTAGAGDHLLTASERLVRDRASESARSAGDEPNPRFRTVAHALISAREGASTRGAADVSGLILGSSLSTVTAARTSETSAPSATSTARTPTTSAITPMRIVPGGKPIP